MRLLKTKKSTIQFNNVYIKCKYYKSSRLSVIIIIQCNKPRKLQANHKWALHLIIDPNNLRKTLSIGKKQNVNTSY